MRGDGRTWPPTPGAGDTVRQGGVGWHAQAGVPEAATSARARGGRGRRPGDIGEWGDPPSWPSACADGGTRLCGRSSPRTPSQRLAGVGVNAPRQRQWGCEEAGARAGWGCWGPQRPTARHRGRRRARAGGQARAGQKNHGQQQHTRGGGRKARRRRGRGRNPPSPQTPCGRALPPSVHSSRAVARDGACARRSCSRLPRQPPRLPPDAPTTYFPSLPLSPTTIPSSLPPRHPPSLPRPRPVPPPLPRLPRPPSPHWNSYAFWLHHSSTLIGGSPTSSS